ncbi:MAG: hypothetical protein EP326_00210, partial [Deltaproteobacteria bacterium]
MRYSKTHLLLSLFFPLSYFFNRGWLKLSNNLMSIGLLLFAMFLFLEMARFYSLWIERVLMNFKFKGFVRMFGLCFIFFLLAISRQFGIYELLDRDYKGFTYDQGKTLCQNAAFSSHCNQLARHKRYKEENYQQAFELYHLTCHAGHMDSCNSGGWMLVLKYSVLKEHLSEALEMGKLAVADGPYHENLHSTVAALYYLSKNQQKAIEHQTKAVELHAIAMKRKHSHSQFICENRQNAF